MSKILLIAFSSFLLLPSNQAFSQDTGKEFGSISELLKASQKLTPDAAEALLKSVDVVAIAKAQMENGGPHYLGDARYAIEFPGLFDTFSNTVKLGQNYTVVGPTDCIDIGNPRLKVQYAQSELAFRFNLAMFHFDNAKNKHLKLTKTLQDAKIFFEIPKGRWATLPLISKLKMLSACTDYEDRDDDRMGLYDELSLNELDD